MITEYIQTIWRKAHYEFLPNDQLYYGEIPLFEGVYATEAHLEDFRESLREVLEEWILLSMYKNLPLPSIDNISLQIKESA